MTDPRPTRQDPSPWAMSGVLFAASILLLIGCFQIIVGLVAILRLTVL